MTCCVTEERNDLNALDLVQFFTNFINGLKIVLAAKDGRTGNEGIGTGFSDFSNVVSFNATINLQANVKI